MFGNVEEKKINILMRTSGLGASSKPTRGGAGQYDPCCGSNRVFFSYVMLSYVSCCRGETHCEGSIVFSSLLWVFRYYL